MEEVGEDKLTSMRISGDNASHSHVAIPVPDSPSFSAQAPSSPSLSVQLPPQASSFGRNCVQAQSLLSTGLPSMNSRGADLMSDLHRRAIVERMRRKY